MVEMTSAERFYHWLRGEKIDRLPVVEWAGWWDQTLARWYEEGLPRGVNVNQYGGRIGCETLEFL